MVGKLDIGRGDDGGFFPRLAKAKAEGANVDPLDPIDPPEPPEPPAEPPEPCDTDAEPAPKKRKAKKGG